MTANVADLVRQQANLRPASPAIITHDQIITYGQLNVAVGVVARHLRQSGVVPGQVVGISMGQNPLHVITILALAQVGAISLPLHTAVPLERRLLAAKRFGAACVVSGRSDMALPGLIFVSLANLPFDGSSLPPDMEMHPVGDDEAFRIVISSGTSGNPKGMVLSHGLTAARLKCPDAGCTEVSRTLPMDLNFIVGFRPGMSALITGGAVILPRSMDSQELLSAMIRHAVTHIYLSPAQARAMVNQFATEGIRCPDVVCLRIGGGPVTAELLREVRQKISPNVYVSYGSTESGLITYADPKILSKQPGSVGKMCSWATVEAVDTADRRINMGEIGILRMRSEHQVDGYLNDHERTEKSFRNGWFYPGDLGGFDEDGLLYIEGRVDDQLNIGGLKINPEEIDAALLTHADVMDAGTFALLSDEGNEALAAAVIVRSGGDIDSLENYARTKLGPLAPASYFIVSALPRTVTGKLRRNELAALFSQTNQTSGNA